MSKTTMQQIEENTITSQQEAGFAAYTKQVEEGFRTAGLEDFQSFYSLWCAEEGLFNDISDSNFPVSERPVWA
jgi:hypothetical protein